MQSIVKAVRLRVSADKNRYLDGNFDLDLTYITDRIIAMSFPADGMESTYRNSIHEVSAMLNYRHYGHFMVFNLSERNYEYGILNDMVLDWCGFPDHHAPPLALLCKIIRTMHAWLEADALNVVVVHCLAGKGRTGTVIASYLLYAGLFNSAQDAMNYFALKRSNNSWGITGPSQKRYTHYFADAIQKKIVPRSSPVVLKMIIMHTIPQFTLGPMRQGICPVLQISSNSPQGGPGRLIYSSQEGQEGEELKSFPSSDRSLAFHVNRVVRGDLLITFNHVNAFYRMEQMLRFNFHTGMFEMPRLRLTKSELDGAEGDKRFDYNFFLDLVFEEIDGDMGVVNHSLWDYSIETEQQLFIWKQDISSGSICFNHEPGSSVVDKIQKARTLASNRGFVVGKSGWLTKKGHQVKNWKRRWFVLKDSTLSYYKSPKQTTPAGVIPVSDIWRVVSDSEVSKREEMPLCFELITCKVSNTAKIVTYVISAANDADREDWIQCIETAMSSSFEVGRLYVDIIDARFKYAGNSKIAEETVYCTLVFGRQRFQSVAVPSVPARWDQSAEFVVFEEPNDLVVGLYLQADDSVLASLVVDASEIQQKAIEIGTAIPEESHVGDFWVTLVPTNIAMQRYQISGIDFHIACKFRSSSDIVNASAAADDDTPTDVFNESVEGDFLVVPTAKERERHPKSTKPRVRSSSLGALTQQKSTTRSSTLNLESSPYYLDSTSTSNSNSTPIGIPPTVHGNGKAEDVNWTKPEATNPRGQPTITTTTTTTPPTDTTPPVTTGARPHGSTVSGTTTSSTDSPISNWFGKMANNLLNQLDTSLGGRPPSATLRPQTKNSPSGSPNHSPGHSPRSNSKFFAKIPPTNLNLNNNNNGNNTNNANISNNNTSNDQSSIPDPIAQSPPAPPRPDSPPPILTPHYPHYHPPLVPSPPEYVAPAPPPPDTPAPPPPPSSAPPHPDTPPPNTPSNVQTSSNIRTSNQELPTSKTTCTSNQQFLSLDDYITNANSSNEHTNSNTTTNINENQSNWKAPGEESTSEIVASFEVVDELTV